MGALFSELSQRRNELLHRWSTWQEVIAHLSKFVGTDAAPPKLGVTTRGEGLTVPPEIVEAVMEEAQLKIDELMAECTKIEQTMMEDRNVVKKPTRGKEEAKGRKGR